MTPAFAEIVRLSEHPERVESARELLRDYILLPDVWQELGDGAVPVELPDFFAEEFAQFPRPAAPPTGEVLVATHRSAIVGLAEIVAMDGNTCEFKRVHVVGEHQGSGIGKLLARALLAEARRLGYGRAVLDVFPSRTRALALWRSFGFLEIEPYRIYPFPEVFLGRSLDDSVNDASGL